MTSSTLIKVSQPSHAMEVIGAVIDHVQRIAAALPVMLRRVDAVTAVHRLSRCHRPWCS